MFPYYYPIAVLAASTLINASPLAQQASPTSNTPSPAAPSAADPSLLQALELAPTLEQRQSILTANGTSADNLITTFTNTTGILDSSTFPALIGTHNSFALGTFPPCALAMPHHHPRATEFFTVVTGEILVTQLLSNDVLLNYTLKDYQATVIPQGYTHYQFNPTCDSATASAAFDSNDPGRVKAAASFFAILDGDAMVSTAEFPEVLAPANVDRYRATVGHFASAVDSCAQKCGLAGGKNSSAPMKVRH